MAIPRLLFKDEFQAATIAASSEDTDFPKENIQNELRTKTWRTTAAVGVSATVTFDLGYPPPLINAIALVGGNLYSEANLSKGIKANATDSWGSPSVNELFVINTNLVSNGPFTADTTGWAAVNCTIASVATASPIAGNSLEITRASATAQSATQTVSGFKIGRRYILSGWVLSGGAGNEAFQIKLGSDAHLISGTTSGIWTQYKLVFTAQETSMVLSCVKNTATASTMHFDEIRIYEIPESDMFIHYMAADYRYRYWQLNLNNGTGSYYELGRVMGGLYSAPARNIVPNGFNKQLSDLTNINRTPGGHAHSDYKTVYNDLALKFSLMSAADRDRVESMYRNNRLSKNIAIHVDPNDADKAFYGKFAAKPLFDEDGETGSNLYNYDLNFTESV